MNLFQFMSECPVLTGFLATLVLLFVVFVGVGIITLVKLKDEKKENKNKVL